MNVRHRLRTAPALVVTFALSILVAVGVAAIVAPFSVSADEAQPITLVAFGDSLMAGYGVKASESFPAQLQMALQAKGYKVTVVNAGVSGDTTADGLRRFDWAMQPKPDGVILELGANDALRGIDPKEPSANLDKMLASLKLLDVPVLLTGMKAPNNWGDDYVKAFDAIYTGLASKYDVPLYPFFLDGVALDPGFSQPDGLHPTASGIGEVVKRILPDVEALVQRISQRKTAAK
ncbi:multifunctional: acyl-CoA thioesterase I; protease I; lysophospholipaseL(I) [Hyphomicrobium sp. GJ21]|uniref:arylesterase n=1 Tax=Hyphomicrobium sp. GJ21 TaxID=113574 RepID=UPI000622B986|nr:arylesterase [Hyphomicrobium sp. GJ21]CEJ83323.1 multifunctional: acyl-CoA thioesterase I; protease I; lysophospholipaseL(I) [Hyphomicrobium sp. GJ21]